MAPSHPIDSTRILTLAAALAAGAATGAAPLSHLGSAAVEPPARDEATATGCVRAAGPDERYVLTAASVDPPLPGTDEATRVALPLAIDGAVDVDRYVGRQVEVTGTLDDSRDDRPALAGQPPSPDAGETGTRAGMAGSTETAGQTGSVSTTGRTEETARDIEAIDPERPTLSVSSIRQIAPTCEPDP